MRNAKYVLLAAGLLVVLSTFTTGCGKKTVMTVNGEAITKDQFMARLERYQFQTPGGTTPQAGPACLNDMINEMIVAQIAKDKKVEPTEEQIKAKLDLLKKEGAMKQMLATGLTENEIKEQIKNRQAYINIVSKGEKSTAKEAEDFYNAAKSQLYSRPEQVQIGVIACKDKKNIDKAAQLIQSGQEFSSVALKISEDITKQNGGLAGWVSRNDERIPEVVRKASWDLKKGKMSSAFQVPGDNSKKWYLIKAIDKRPARTQSFKDVKDSIMEEIRFSKGRTKVDFAKLLEGYRKKAKITANDKKYENLTKSENASAPAATE